MTYKYRRTDRDLTELKFVDPQLYYKAILSLIYTAQNIHNLDSYRQPGGISL